MLEGLADLHPGLAILDGENVILRADTAAAGARQVGPCCRAAERARARARGLCRRGMLTAAVAGDVFTSPSVDAVLAAIRASAGPAGALLIVKNYTGDRLNFGLAAELARARGHPGRAASLWPTMSPWRRASPASAAAASPARCWCTRVAGAAAAAGLQPGRCARPSARAAADLGTMGVALGACTVPAAGAPGFALGDDEIELGLGIHGEAGVRRGRMKPADVLVRQVMDRIMTVRQIGVNSRLCSSSIISAELPRWNWRSSRVRRSGCCRVRQIRVERVLSGTFLTAIEMAGFSISLLTVDDGRLERICAHASAAAWVEPRHPQSQLPVIASPMSITTSAPRNVDTGMTQHSDAHAERLRRAITLVAHSLLTSEPLLTRLDSAVGDGDLGISLARGSRAVLSSMDQYDLRQPQLLLRQIAETLRRELGGTSGPLYKRLAAAHGLATATGWLAVACAMGRSLCSRLRAVGDLGGAKCGERTMLDALVPAAQSLRVGAHAGQPAVEVLKSALHAAEAGCLATQSLAPRRGRSSYLGERAIGHPDPGATAVTIWLQALVQASSADSTH